MGTSAAAKWSDQLPDTRQFEACCAGLTPVLEAVDELPRSGLPISASAQSRVKQFFVKQISTAPAAAGAGGSPSTKGASPAAGSLCMRPQDLQDTKQLQETLQKHVKPVLVPGTHKDLTALVSAAIQLVADAAHQVARQQVVEKNSSAYSVLLDEGYRAGVMAQSCAALKAGLGLRIITDLQLACVMAVGCEIINKALVGGPGHEVGGMQYSYECVDSLAVATYAWRHLKAYYSGSRSALPPPAWASGGESAFKLLSAFMEVAVPCFKESALPPNVAMIKICHVEAAPFGSLPGSQALTVEGPAAGLAALMAGLEAMGGSVPTHIPGGKTSADSAAKSSSGSKASGAADSPAAGTGSAAADSATRSRKSASSGEGSGPGIEAQLEASILDMSLPLDDCALLAADCKGLTPLLAATAAWVQAGSGDNSPLRAAVKSYVAGQIDSRTKSSAAAAAAAAGSSSDRSRRRTIVPAFYAHGNNTLQEVKVMLDWPLTSYFSPYCSEAAVDCQGVPALVESVLKEVAREQVLEKRSAAYMALCSAGHTAGAAVIGCVVLQTGMGVTIKTEQQLFEGLKVCCEGVKTACGGGTSVFPGKKQDPEAMNAAAFNIYQTLARLTATDSASSSSSSGGSNGSSKLQFFMPASCSLNDAYRLLDGFAGTMTVMWECQGPLTVTEALARKAKLKPLTEDAIAALMTLAKLTGLGPGMASRGSSASAGSAAAADAEQDSWGKGSALAAGLKGLFQKAGGASSKAAETAAKPAAQNSSSTGAAVPSSSSSNSSSSAAKQQQAGAAGNTGGQAGKAVAVHTSNSGAVVAKQQQAAAAGKAGTTSTSSSGSASGTTAKAVTPPELLVKGNLQKWYCSPATFDLASGAHGTQPLPQDALQVLVKLQLHTKYRDHGWNALHYACAAQRVEVVKQLIEAGADLSEPEDQLSLQPLHLACIGAITASEQFHELFNCVTIPQLQKFVSARSQFNARLVELLLHSGADPNAVSALLPLSLPARGKYSLAPLHIITIFTPDSGSQEATLVFHNPFMGKAVLMCEHFQPPRAMGVYHANLDLGQASAGILSVRSREGSLDLSYKPYSDFPKGLDGKDVSADYRMCEENVGYGLSLADAVDRLKAARLLLHYNGDENAVSSTTGETALHWAAYYGNAAVTDLLLRVGADPEKTRSDGARPLEVAADSGHSIVGWTLLCHGAEAVPQWMRSGKPRPVPVPGPDGDVPDPGVTTPEMLLCHAVQCEARPWNIRFLERLLGEWPSLEGVWAETGETPLLMAINYNDEEMVRLLVMAGANVNAVLEAPGTPAIADALYKGKRGAETEDIVQTLVDAGADFTSWQDSQTDYDVLQTAANKGYVEICLKLVEAGAKWQLPKQQRMIGGSVYYAPDILAITVPNLKANFAETRFKMAEKKGRTKRAAAATALQPWLSPGTTQECKDATIKTLCTAGVTPSPPPNQRTARPPPSPGRAPAVRTPKWKQLPQVQVERGLLGTGGSQAGAEEGVGGGAVSAATALEADPTDIDAVLAEIESVGAKGSAAAAASGGSSGSGGKSAAKKKLTAAQKEARKKEQQRLQRLQQQDQGDGSGSDSEAEAGVGDSSTAGDPAAVGMQARLGHITASQDGLPFGSEMLSHMDDEAVSLQQLPAAAQQQQQELSQQQQQAQQQQQQQKKKTKKSKALQQRAAKQQASVASSEAASSPSSAGSQQGHQSLAQQQSVASPVAVPPAQQEQQQAGSQCKQRAPADTPAAAAAAALPIPLASVSPPAAAVAAFPAVPAAPPAAAAPAASAGRSSPQPAARAVFLPPHLAMRMPAAAPAPAAAAAPRAPGVPPQAGVAAAATAAAVAPGQGVSHALQTGHAQQPVLQQQLSGGVQVLAGQQQAQAVQHAPVAEPVPHSVVQQQQAGRPQQQPVAQEPQRVSGFKARMVELAQQHQLQEQQLQAAARQPPPQQQAQKGPGPTLPELPSAMMAFLSGSCAQRVAADTARMGGHGGPSAAGGGAAATGQQHAQRPTGAKRQPPAAAPVKPAASPANGHHPRQHTHHQQQQQQPQQAAPAAARAAGEGPAAAPAAAAAAGGGTADASTAGKGLKLCVACSQRRRNVLLIPCGHMVLCDTCADPTQAPGTLGDCPTCHKPVTQRIKVHQS